MQALCCQQYGPPESLVLTHLEERTPGQGQVRVQIHAAGVNFVDALFIAGTYQVKIPPPFIPGNEWAGVIDAIGANVIGWQVGDAVMAQSGTGAFAQSLVIDARQLRRKPAALTFAQAAGFQLTYATALYALRERGALLRGETLLVLGAAGGVGSAAIEIGKYFGARVIAAAKGAEKLAFCRALGADAVIDYENEDLRERMKVLTDGRGADVVYDPVGDRFSEPALRSTAWQGRFLVIGFAAGSIAKIPLNLPLLKGCQIVGVYWGQLARTRPTETEPVWTTLVHWAELGVLHPRIHQSYPLAQGAQALSDVLQRKVLGKAVITPIN